MKRVLVTGSNKGIGLAIIEALLKRDDIIAILCSRDASRGAIAHRRLLDAHPEYNGRLECVTLDVTSDTSISSAKEIIAQSGKLFAIVNNAGILAGNVEDILATNYYGVGKVTEAFVPLIADGGRVVNVSSGAGPMFVEKCSPEKKRIFTDLAAVDDKVIESVISEFKQLGSAADPVAASNAAGFGGDFGDAFFAYGFSKACLNMYTMFASKQYPHLKINACSPGMIKTDLLAPVAQAAGMTIDELGQKWGAVDVRESVHSTVHLLFSEDPSVQTGQYFGSDAKRSPMGRYRKPGSDPYDGSDGN